LLFSEAINKLEEDDEEDLKLNFLRILEFLFRVNSVSESESAIVGFWFRHFPWKFQRLLKSESFITGKSLFSVLLLKSIDSTDLMSLS